MNQPHLDESTLNEYMDGIYSGSDPGSELALERAQIEAHLASCEACRMRLAEVQWLFVALDNLPKEEPSRDFALNTMALLNASAKAQANHARTPALGFVTLQLLMTVIVAALLWPFLSPFVWRMAEGWSQPLLREAAIIQFGSGQFGAAWPVLRALGEQWRQTVALLGQQVGAGGWQALDLLPLPKLLPQLSVTLWLSLLGAICLLWAVATRWLLFLPTVDHSQTIENGEAR